MLFKSCPLLRHWAAEHERVFSTFMEYKVRVPVCGAILLNESLSKALLVRGWKASAGWGFPKGKINQGESETSCAIREVTFINAERRINDQRIRLYIISGIDEDVQFSTQTRKEIGDIKWHPINSLPGYHNPELDSSSKYAVHTNNKKHKYYMVTPFVSGLRKWLRRFKKAKQQGKKRKDAHLKVSMDYASDGSDNEDMDSAPTHADYSNEYTSTVPRNQQVHLESSLKKLLGIGGQAGDEHQPRQHQARPHYPHLHPPVEHSHLPPIPFGGMPSMEMPSIYAQPEYANAQYKNQKFVNSIPAQYPPSVVDQISNHQTSNYSETEPEPEKEEKPEKNMLMDILTGKSDPKSDVKKKKEKKPPALEYGKTKILSKQDKGKEDSNVLSILCSPTENNPPSSASTANKDGLLKLLVHGNQPVNSSPDKDKGLEEVLSGKLSMQNVSARNSFFSRNPSEIENTHDNMVSPGEKQSLMDILRGAPPPPTVSQQRPSIEQQKQLLAGKSSLLDILHNKAPTETESSESDGYESEEEQSEEEIDEKQKNRNDLLNLLMGNK
ncbi:mRNA-decapping enzyme subunit 2 [Terramyces sp. JEL0728]|nr:mRNA-decapping enzyme subunit 2 [Terramyces sp. JEL0728]